MQNNPVLHKAIEYKLNAVKTDNNFDSIKVTKSMDAFNFCRQFYYDDIYIYESFFILLLNRANRINAWVKISQGGITATVCDPLLILKYTIETLSKGVILCHNHPSGSTTPSNQDIELTKKIKGALSCVEVKLMDHIILAENNYYSLADNGQI